MCYTVLYYLNKGRQAMPKQITIICGHYGSGKTNFALNLAIDRMRRGEAVTVVDLDIVNPYFRSSDYTGLLEENGVTVISPATAGTTVDAPALTARMASVFQRGEGAAIIDAGGDDAGAAALGRFSKRIEDSGSWQMLYVINKYRRLISSPEEAVALLREIEASSRLRATGIVNNSHLAGLTTAEDILSSVDYARKTAALCGLPLLMTTAPKAVSGELEGKVNNLYPVDILVKLPWNT